MRVTLNWLSEVTGKHFATVKKHLDNLPRDQDGKLESKKALQILFNGGDGVTHSEALRKLAIAREEQIRADIRIKDEGTMPLDEVTDLYNELIRHMQITRTANKGKLISDQTVLEVTDDLEALILNTLPAKSRERVTQRLNERERYNAEIFLIGAQRDLESIARQRKIDARFRELHAAELTLSKDPTQANTDRLERAMEALWPNTAQASIPERYRKLTHSE
jgi:hypothetical protein